MLQMLRAKLCGAQDVSQSAGGNDTKRHSHEVILELGTVEDTSISRHFDRKGTGRDQLSNGTERQDSCDD